MLGHTCQLPCVSSTLGGAEPCLGVARIDRSKGCFFPGAEVGIGEQSTSNSTQDRRQDYDSSSADGDHATDQRSLSGGYRIGYGNLAGNTGL